MNIRTSKLDSEFKKNGIYAVLHIIILIISLFLVICISIDTFKNLAFYRQSRFMSLQFWICIVFLADFFIELVLSKNKWRYFRSHFIFLLVSIPYNSIINTMGWEFSPQITYCFRYIPLIRGGYAMAIVISWFTYNRATGLFISYLVTLICTIYFASLAFYLFEHDINPLVVDYDSALWWASMDATTVGSNIIAVTGVGKVLSVLLAALGMMMFPIFTVYVTNIIKAHNTQGDALDKVVNIPLITSAAGNKKEGGAPSAGDTPPAQ